MPDADRKTLMHPTGEILAGLVGLDARTLWDKLAAHGDGERMTAVLRFLFAAVIIDEHRGKRGEQPEQRGVAARPQPAGRGQSGRGLQQLADLTVGIHVRRPAVPGRAEQPRRGHLGGAVQSSQVTQETPHRRQPPDRVARIRRGGRRRPIQAQLQRDRTVVPVPVQITGESPSARS
ncbi:MAG TPA: hypothetical protein VK887_12590 [Pseudonocardiaceae bacterium]|nr:hypothetical protein [Pseudonocardiaceae bacterium]